MSEIKHIEFSKKVKGQWQKELLDFVFSQEHLEQSIDTYEKEKNTLKDESIPTLIYIKKVLLFYAHFSNAIPRHVTEEHAMGVSNPAIIKLENDYAKSYLKDIVNNNSNPQSSKRDLLEKTSIFYVGGNKIEKNFDAFSGYLMYAIDFTVNITATELLDIYLDVCSKNPNINQKENNNDDDTSDFSDSDDEQLIKYLEYAYDHAQYVTDPDFINNIKTYITSSYETYLNVTKKCTDAAYVVEPLTYLKEIIEIKTNDTYCTDL